MSAARLASIGAILTAALAFFWHIPEVSAVRYSLLAASIALLFGAAKYKEFEVKSSVVAVRPMIYIFTSFVGWSYLHAALFAKESAWSFGELNIQLLPASFAFVLGVLVGSLADKKGSFSFTWLLALLFAAYMTHILYVDLFALRHYVEFREVPLRIAGLTKGHDEVSFLVATFSAFIASELFFRFALKKKVLPINDSLFLFIFALFVAALLIQAKRNGMISAGFLVFSLLFLWLYEKRGALSKKAMWLCVSLALFTVSLIGYASYKLDPRWKSFAKTVEIALDTKTHKAWLGWEKYGAPLLPNGQPVDHSNYMRLAWIKEGAILITDNPLGYGYGRNVCGHAFAAKYGEGGGHSHSGFIDFGVGVGVFGLLLWYTFVVFAAYSGIRAYMSHKSYAGMVLFFLAVGFGFRMLIDSVNRDHMLEQFAFLSALLFTLAARDKLQGGRGGDVAKQKTANFV